MMALSAHDLYEQVDPAMPWAFALATPDRPLFASGLRRRLPGGPAFTLAQRVRDFFANQAGSGAPLLLVGAIPFDRMADDCLFEPDIVRDEPWPAFSTPIPAGQGWQLAAEPTRSGYEAAVARALEQIGAVHVDAVQGHDANALSKIVLSRSLRLTSATPIDVMALSSQLSGDPGAVRFLVPVTSEPEGAPSHLVGATPELLISKRGRDILSHPLAGSARRSDDPATDNAAAAGLMGSAKDQREHRWVVEAILDGLAPYCSQLSAPAEPALVSTRSMWHLGTRIEGQLKDAQGVSAAELAAVLHPTPAVGGTPRNKAVALIPELEGYDRGFYAGAVGWTDYAGDGAWYVSLRCAEVSGHQARVYAGAGIVQGSVPAEEAAETSAKFRAMLQAFGLNEQNASEETNMGAHA